jgi:hypothetical protein
MDFADGQQAQLLPGTAWYGSMLPTHLSLVNESNDVSSGIQSGEYVQSGFV